MKTSLIRYKRALLFIPVLIFAAFLYTGCSKSTNSGYSNNTGNGTGSGPGPGQVWMQNTKFVPSAITISVNGTVTWINKDEYSHDITADDNSFLSGNVAAGKSYSHKFTVAGTYNYRCTIHAGMSGTVVVM
jgi:plastocyanin